MNLLTMMNLIYSTNVPRGPADEGGGGGGGGEAGAGGGEAGGGGGEAGAAGGEAGGGGGEAGAGNTGEGKAWFETIGFASEDTRTALIGAGFHKAPDAEAALALAVDANAAAEKKLGVPSGELIRIPGGEDKPAEWRTRNAAALGVPDDAKGYELAAPDDLPEGLKWSQEKADALAARAHERGWPKDVVRDAMADYIADQKAAFQEVSQEYQAADQALNEALMKEWGGEVQGRTGMAVRAFHHFAEKAGISVEARDDLQARMMKGGKITDAQVVKLFHEVSLALGEDTLAGDVLRAGGGAGVFTPAEANARREAIKGPGGEYAKAHAAGDTAKLKALRGELERLAKISAQGKG